MVLLGGFVVENAKALQDQTINFKAFLITFLFRQETKEAQLYAAQAHLKLGEVSVESGNAFSNLAVSLTSMSPISCFYRQKNRSEFLTVPRAVKQP